MHAANCFSHTILSSAAASRCKIADISPILLRIAVKFPQILRILINKSAEGLSFFGLYLELINYTITCLHCFRHNNPLVYVPAFPDLSGLSNRLSEREVERTAYGFKRRPRLPATELWGQRSFAILADPCFKPLSVAVSYTHLRAHET